MATKVIPIIIAVTENERPGYRVVIPTAYPKPPTTSRVRPTANVRFILKGCPPLKKALSRFHSVGGAVRGVLHLDPHSL